MADNSVQYRVRGTAMLEFAVTALLLGVIGAFALDRITHLQVSADRVAEQTRTAQSASLATLGRARGTLAQRPAPCATPSQGAPSRSPAPSVSCPRSLPTGVLP